METQIFNGKTYKLYPGERYFSRGSKRLHRVVWEFHRGSIPKGMHVHHKDGNAHNNSIGNLALKLPAAHLSEHMTPERRKQQREWVDKIRHLASEWHSSEEGIAWHRELGRKMWENKPLMEHVCIHCHVKFSTRGSARVCGQNCKMKARRRRLKGLPEDAVL